jgi:60 kDa SS-A/Ro ribonucleoprotein
MKLNTTGLFETDRTHEGAAIKPIDAAHELKRAVMSHFLWEDEFYESGESIAKRISNLVPRVSPENVAALAVEARTKMNLRHVPLFLCVEMLKHKSHRTLVRSTLNSVILRPDELTEALALYWKGGRCKIAKQLQRGLADAFPRFSAYQLAKYNRQDAPIKLRDVLFLSHARPKNEEQARVWKQLIDGALESPDTWEVNLSAGADKRATFERLIEEGKLGGLALLRNLRNMIQSGVRESLVKEAIKNMNTERILPFRFIAAAKYAPRWEPELETAMLRSLDGAPKMKGRTALIIDTSPSMWQAKVSAKSEMDRFEAAAALAILARELCEDIAIWAFNEKAIEVAPRRGFALRDALAKTKGGYSRGGLAVEAANKRGYDRIIVLTDGQWHYRPAIVGSYDTRFGRYSAGDSMGDGWKVSPPPIGRNAYMLNVASYKNGVGYGQWNVIDGWSERVLEYIGAIEGSNA